MVLLLRGVLHVPLHCSHMALKAFATLYTVRVTVLPSLLHSSASNVGVKQDPMAVGSVRQNLPSGGRGRLLGSGHLGPEDELRDPLPLNVLLSCAGVRGRWGVCIGPNCRSNGPLAPRACPGPHLVLRA